MPKGDGVAIRALYNMITIAAHVASVEVHKTHNTNANVGVTPELALAVALHTIMQRETEVMQLLIAKG